MIKGDYSTAKFTFSHFVDPNVLVRLPSPNIKKRQKKGGMDRTKGCCPPPPPCHPSKLWNWLVRRRSPQRDDDVEGHQHNNEEKDAADAHSPLGALRALLKFYCLVGIIPGSLSKDGCSFKVNYS